MTRFTDRTYVRNGVDIRLLARRQRLMLWLVLACFASILMWVVVFSTPGLLGGSPTLIAVFWMVYQGLRLAALVGVILIMRALRTNLFILIICVFLMFIPLVNLLVILLENSAATRRLREAGLHIGLMGVKDEEVVLKLTPGICRSCGYDLRGAESDVCSECGAAIPPETRAFIARISEIPA